ncbi:nif-specific transcriptional activator NifA [Alteraurantiacibacter aquimixticola]|uniref:Nif-specific regulatory protein n=2 Tax=Alteraurantiacibacter aquimixticola TaxID=2489173 RepID=A0A4T3F7H3_9SPHN|nr:nif-specific transcriptional activator NifA [Alteraurantiacibacter aquimixticola]TIX51652.1 nif-specific transcriptional activator NifA [Alteraurantiacibacter aquimixticola]
MPVIASTQGPGRSGLAVNGTASRKSHTRADIALRGVYEISKILAVPSGRLEVTLGNVLTLLSSFLDMNHGLIMLVDEHGNPANVVGIGWSEELAQEWSGQVPEQAVCQIIATEMPVVVHNMDNSPLFDGWHGQEAPSPDVRRSFIGVPIKVDKRVAGALTIEQDWDESTTYHAADEDVRFLTMVANLIGQTIALMELVRRDRERLLDRQRLLEKVISESAERDSGGKTRGIVGSSPALNSALQQIRLAARSKSTVLLRGESGTGKELFAHALHDNSQRRKQPFVKLNCAALPESVLESELFGHEKGAFTGAVNQRKGRFEMADGGTLFLDEIGDISPAFQAKLLRVLQEGEFERVGGTRTIKVDVRLVCATNRNLEEAVKQGEFRADLYYRINVVSIQLPPLRNRREDIAELAFEFLRRFDQENDTTHELADSALTILEQCNFPGNVRELENCIRRTATMALDARISDNDLACQHNECLSAKLWNSSISAPLPVFQPMAEPEVQQAERDLLTRRAGDEAAPATEEGQGNTKIGKRELVDALERTGWVQAKAARLLNLTPRQIGYAIRKYGIEVKRI